MGIIVPMGAFQFMEMTHHSSPVLQHHDLSGYWHALLLSEGLFVRKTVTRHLKIAARWNNSLFGDAAKQHSAMGSRFAVNRNRLVAVPASSPN